MGLSHTKSATDVWVIRSNSIVFISHENSQDNRIVKARQRINEQHFICFLADNICGASKIKLKKVNKKRTVGHLEG
jgi:hypothetical protein